MRNYQMAFGLAAVFLMAAVAYAFGFSPEHAAFGGYAAMAVVQSAYTERQPVAIAGMIATGNGYDADTYIAETAAGIGFGLAVCQGTADKGCTLAGAANKFLGVSIRDVTLVHSAAADLDKYKRYENVGVLTRGDIWVTVSGAVNAGDNVTYETTTGAFGSVGADGTHILVTGARFMTTAADGGLAKLRVTGYGHAA